MSTSGSFAPGSDLNRGPTVLITSWALVGVASIFVIARAAARRKLTKAEAGDILLPVSLVLAFVQTALIQIAVDNGLGEPYGSLGAHATDTYFEILYWAQLLYIVILGLTKTTVVLLVTTLQPKRGIRIACWIASTIVVTSTLACLLVSAFQCQLPYPWLTRSQHCIDLPIFWNTLGAINVATDLLVVSLPVTAVYLLPINPETRWFIGTLISTRILVPIFTVVQICWLQTYAASTDPTFDIVPYQVWTQVVLNVSIVTACIPSLGGLLTDLASNVTGKRITLGDINLARYSQHNVWRFSRQSKSDLRKSERYSRPGEMEQVRRSSSIRPGRPTRYESRSDSEYSTRSSNQFSWFKLNRSQNYVIGSNTDNSPGLVPAPLRPYDHPARRYGIEPALKTPAPAVLSHKSKGSVTFDVLDDYSDTRSNHFDMSSSDNSPRKSNSTRGRWSVLISNAAKIPPPVHSRGTSNVSSASSSHGTSRTFSSIIIHSHNNSASSASKVISSPSFLYSSAPVVPQRNPARTPAEIRPNTADSNHHRYPPTSFPLPAPPRPTTAGSSGRGHSRNRSIHGTHGSSDSRPIRSASYRSHRSKVSNVSARSEKLSIEEGREDSPTFESQYFADDNNNNKKDDSDYEEVDLHYDRNGRF